MASITLDNGSILNLSLAEVRELLGTVNVARPGTVELTVEPQEQPKKQRRNSTPAENQTTETETLHCVACDSDFSRAKSRGRKPNMCPSCKGNSNSEAAVVDSPVAEDNSEQSEQPKAKRNNNNGGGRRRNSSSFDEWLEKNGDKPMTEKMEKSIRWMLTSRQVSEANSAKIEKALNANPRINCKAASKIISFMHGLEKVAA